MGQNTQPFTRLDARPFNALRELTCDVGFAKHAEGSCLVRFGDTHVLVTASLEEKVPPFLRNSGQERQSFALKAPKT
jgi:ribonuclease PH